VSVPAQVVPAATGQIETSGHVDCPGRHAGEVVVHKGVLIPPDEGPWISIGYTGTNCVDCRWYQFNWREIQIYTKDGRSSAKAAHIQLPNVDYELTTDANNPNWHLDSFLPEDPAYPGASQRNADSDTIFDGPSSGIDALAGVEKADPNVIRIRSLFHGQSFLVCGGQVCASVTWSTAYGWTRADDRTSGPEYNVLPVDTSRTGPNGQQKAAIDAKYPGQTVFR